MLTSCCEWGLCDRSKGLLRRVRKQRDEVLTLSVPDIKAYLCLLGTDGNKLVWFHRDESQNADNVPSSAEENQRRDACNAAVRRGAERLLQYQQGGDG